VDGGIDQHTAPAASEAGADVLVAGTAVFRHPAGVRTAIANLHAATA
jgi:ribulose-phosphate 3-epimerase